MTNIQMLLITMSPSASSIGFPQSIDSSLPSSFFFSVICEKGKEKKQTGQVSRQAQLDQSNSKI